MAKNRYRNRRLARNRRKIAAFAGLVALVLLLPASSESFRSTPETASRPAVADNGYRQEVDRQEVEVAEADPRTVLRDDSWPLPPENIASPEPATFSAPPPDQDEAVDSTQTYVEKEEQDQEPDAAIDAQGPNNDDRERTPQEIPDTEMVNRIYDVAVAMATIHSDPAVGSETIGVVGEGVRVTASRVENEWAYVEVDGGGSGWVELSAISEDSSQP